MSLNVVCYTCGQRGHMRRNCPTQTANTLTVDLNHGVNIFDLKDDEDLEVSEEDYLRMTALIEEIYANAEQKCRRIAQEEPADAQPGPSATVPAPTAEAKPIEMEVDTKATEKKIRKALAEPNYFKSYQKQPTDLIERLLEAKIEVTASDLLYYSPTFRTQMTHALARRSNNPTNLVDTENHRVTPCFGKANIDSIEVTVMFDPGASTSLMTRAI
jgi:Zinc knuckle